MRARLSCFLAPSARCSLILALSSCIQSPPLATEPILRPSPTHLWRHAKHIVPPTPDNSFATVCRQPRRTRMTSYTTLSLTKELSSRSEALLRRRATPQSLTDDEPPVLLVPLALHPTASSASRETITFTSGPTSFRMLQFLYTTQCLACHSAEVKL